MREANDNGAIQLFDGKKIRTAWDAQQEIWYFSIVDVISVLTDQKTTRGASTYWAVLKKRLVAEGASELLTNCKQFRMLTKSTDWQSVEKACKPRKQTCIQGSLHGRK